MARTGTHTSQMAHFRLDLAFITRNYTHLGPLGSVGLIVQVFPSSCGIRASPYGARMTDRTRVSKPILSTGPLTLPDTYLTETGGSSHGFLRSHGQSCETPVGMLPRHCMRVSSYGFLTGLRTPPKSYGPGTTPRTHGI